MYMTTAVAVDVPREVTYEYYCDQSSLQEWCVNGRFRAFDPVTPPPKQRGSIFRMTYGPRGISFTTTAQMTAMEPGRLSMKDQIEGDYRSYHYEMHFSDTDDGGTFMKMHVWIEFPWGLAGKLIGATSKWMVVRDVDANMRKFKAMAEGRYRDHLKTAASAGERELVGSDMG